MEKRFEIRDMALATNTENNTDRVCISNKKVINVSKRKLLKFGRLNDEKAWRI